MQYIIRNQFALHIRFGGRMVTVGDGVYILGGKERNPEVYLNSIEQFDAKSK